MTRFLHSEVNTGSSKQELLNEICTSLAGRAAEVLCTEVQAGSASDIKRAKHIAEYLIKEEGMGSKLTGKKVDDEIEKLLQVEMQRAQVLLTKNRQVLDRLVNALVKHDVLREADVLKIIANEPGKPFIAPLYVIKSGPDLFSGSQKAATVTNEAEVHDVAFTTPRHPSA